MRNLYNSFIILIISVISTTEIFGQINFRFAISSYVYSESLQNAIEISSIDINVNKSNVYLSWQTERVNNIPVFIVERMSSEDMQWKEIGEVTASGNNSQPGFYSYTDDNLEGGFYSYRLKIVDGDGNIDYSKEKHTEVNPDDFELSQNYPNPFNPSTTITYKLAEKRFVTLKIYNVLGNEITTLVNVEKPAGVYRIEFDVSELKNEISNGTYFYSLKAGDYNETKKMIFMK